MKRGFIIGILLLASSALVWFSIIRRPSKPCVGVCDIEKIVVGTTAEYQPFTFIEGDDVVGFDIDLINDICSRVGIEVILKNMPFTALIPALQSGEIHAAASGLTPTPERAKTILFSQPYLDKDPLLIVTLARSQPLKTVEGLNSKKIIVNEGYTSDTYVSNNTTATIIRVDNPAAGFDALKEETGDAFVIAQRSAQPFFDIHGKHEFNVSVLENSADTYAIAISSRFPELHEKIKDALEKVMRDGTLERLKKKWALR